MRSQSVIALLAFLSVGTARAEVILDEKAAAEPAAPVEYYSQPAVPSIVFVSPEARDAGIAWLPSSTPFVPRPPLMLSIQQQASSPVIINRPPGLGAVYPYPPNTVMAAASLNAAHNYRFGISGASACAPSTLANFRIGLGGYFPLGSNCWLNPYVPIVGGPPGFNRPTDRLPNSLNAVRAVDRAHSYKFKLNQ